MVESWAERHARLCTLLHSAEVVQNVAALDTYAARHDATGRVLGQRLVDAPTDARRLGRELDCAQTLLWGVSGGAEAPSLERARAAAHARLEALQRAALQPSDFHGEHTLQRGATGTVEVVRCRLDRKLYVLKTILKGVARRESYRFSPVLESHLLSHAAAPDAYMYTPRLHAAFQSVRSVHLLMEYFPAGDLDSLLQAAAQAGPSYAGKSDTGLLQEAWVVRYAADMVAALGWLHALQFVHRYVRPLTTATSSRRTFCWTGAGA